MATIKMLRGACVGAGLSIAVAVATPGLASGPDRMGYKAIAAGDFAAAERSIMAERRIFPHQPELTLNLATVYGRTGRIDAARALYRDVLASAPVDLVLANGATYSSHSLAKAGLARLGQDAIAAR
jgi:Flp pilus assembly protein TadD